tara:strand:+ start:3963 stop:4409 length:447 start_codon:yes stop_codon:yes gene_type:complete
MSGGTNQMKPRGTGMPQGFTNKPGGMAGMALQDYHNPTTGQTYTHPNTGANPGEGWMAGKPPPGQEYAQWQDPNAPPRQPGGGWNPGMAGQWGGGFAPPQQGGQTRVSPGFPSQWGQPGGLIGGGQQPQRRFPSMNIPGLLQYNQIDN